MGCHEKALVHSSCSRLATLHGAPWMPLGVLEANVGCVVCFRVRSSDPFTMDALLYL